ncbi:hypothetical protein, partial [Pseudomonas putida]|uniref:hypothetical protein n=1 Tax=Pseudomonas putida TaxID=303 RepID=UPI001C401332
LQASQGGDSWIGLQIRLRRFDSDLGLHHSKAPQINVCGVFLCGSKKPRVPKQKAWGMRYTGPATEGHIAAVEKVCEVGRLRQTLAAAMAWGRQCALDWITERFPPAPTGLEVKPSGRRPSRTSR